MSIVASLERPARLDALVETLWFAPFVACLAGGLALARPSLVYPVFVLDLWLLSFPHVVSTFTRTVFSRRAARGHRALLAGSTGAAFAIAMLLARSGGIVALNTVYFVWQAFHYTRQSYGVARALDREDGSRGGDLLTAATLHLVPLAGFFVRCAERPTLFLGYPVRLPPVSFPLASATSVLAALTFLAWLVRRARAASSDDTLRPAFYVLVHVAMFTMTTCFIRDLTIGWLVLNVWHNVQYLAFVRARNRRDHRAGIDRDAPAFAFVAAPGAFTRYFVVCAGIAALAFGTLFLLVDRSADRTVFLACIQAVNIQHYLVDAVIWRRRAPVTPRAGVRRVLRG